MLKTKNLIKISTYLSIFSLFFLILINLSLYIVFERFELNFYLILNQFIFLYFLLFISLYYENFNFVKNNKTQNVYYFIAPIIYVIFSLFKEMYDIYLIFFTIFLFIIYLKFIINDFKNRILIELPHFGIILKYSYISFYNINSSFVINIENFAFIIILIMNYYLIIKNVDKLNILNNVYQRFTIHNFRNIFNIFYKITSKELSIKLSKALDDLQISKENEYETRQFLLKISNSLPGMIGYWSPDLICKFANKEYSNWFGKSHDEMIGISKYQLLSPDILEKDMPYIKSVLKGEMQQFERKIIKLDGSIRYTWVQYMPDYKENKVVGFFTLISDISKLRETEIRLAERLEVTLNAANIVTWSFNLKNNEFWYSANLSNVYGNNFNLNYNNFFEFLLSKVITKHKKIVEYRLYSMKELQNFFFEFDIYHDEEKSIRSMIIMGKTFFDEINNPIHTVGVIEDITEQKNVEKKLTESLEFQNAILNCANFSIISTDINGLITSFSKESENILMYSSDEVIGKITLDKLHSSSELISRAKELSDELMTNVSPDFQAIISKTNILNAPDDYDCTYVQKNGNLIPVQLSISALKNNENVIFGYLAIAQNIEKLNKAINESKIYHSALNLSAIVAFTDAKGVITHVNDAFCSISGYQRHELIGKTHNILNSKVHPPEFFSELWKTIACGKKWRGEICNRKKTGELYWVDSTITSSRDFLGKINQYISIRFDITKQKQFEIELSKTKEAAIFASNSKAQFLAHMSHEIRNPLNALIGMGELLLNTSLSEKQLKYVKNIESCGDILLGIVNDVLDFSKIEAGKLELEEIKYSPMKMLEKRIDIVAPRAFAKNIKISSFIDPSVMEYVIGDETRIGQVIINLLSNAIKFTEEGTVVCTLKMINRDPPVLQFECQDTGIGMTESQCNRIFQPFSQSDSSMTRKYGGTGLGLSICKSLIESMHGSIGVRSSIGLGSTFWFSVPQKLVEIENKSKKLDYNLCVYFISTDNIFELQITNLCRSWNIDFCKLEPNFNEVKKIINNSNKKNYVLMIKDTDQNMFSFAKEIYELSTYDSIPCLLIYEKNILSSHSIFIPKESFRTLSIPIHQSNLYNNIIYFSKVNLKEDFKVKNQELQNQELQKKLSILVAEDNVVNQELIQTYIEDLGYNVKVVENGDLVIEELKNNTFDLILMDCQMPVKDGLTATKDIRGNEKSNNQHIVIIGLTANATKEDLNSCILAGMNDVLTKPLKRIQLENMILKWFPLTSSPS